MKQVRTAFLLVFALARLGSGEIVGTLNTHTAPDRKTITGRYTGLPIAVQVDFSRTQNGTYDITIWSGQHQFDQTTRVGVQDGKAAQRGKGNEAGRIGVYCPATDPFENGATNFQIFVQAVLDNTNKGGRVQIGEADWQLSSVEDNQPGKKIAPHQIICSAGSDLDQHATGSFLIKNQSDKAMRATLFFGGRKYGDYDLSSHGDEKIQADVWGVNPAVGWYITVPSHLRADAKQIEAAGPIYNTEGGSEAGINTVELNDPDPSPTPKPTPSATPSSKQ